MNDGNAVLAAIRAMRDRLEEAISFSTSALNLTGGQQIEADRADDYYARREAEHQEWDSDFQKAITVLRELAYPTPARWHDITIATPQIAFSEVPVARYYGGQPIGTVWVIGAGYNPEGRANPDWVGGSIGAGETISHESDEAEPDFVAGAFDCSMVEEWSAVLAEILLAEQRLTEQQLRWNSTQASYPADPKGEVYLSPEQIRRHEGLARQVAEAREMGQLERAEAVIGQWRDVPGFGTNTNVKGFLVGAMAVPIGTTTIVDGSGSVGAGKPAVAPQPDETDRTDNRTDNKSPSLEFSDPPDDVRMTARYVREQVVEVKFGRRPRIAKKALIKEYFEQQGWSIAGVDPMAAQLQPKRYGWLLTVPQKIK